MAFVEAQLHGVAKGSTAVADVTATTIDANHNGLDVNIVGGSSSGAVAQGSTTSGQTGSLIQAAVTTAAPTYSTGQTEPLSLTTAGALRVDGSGATQPVSGTITANIGTSGSLALNATLTGGTAQSQITDGTNVASVKAASTAAVATDKALVVAISPNNPITTSAGDTTGGAVTLNALSVTASVALAGQQSVTVTFSSGSSPLMTVAAEQSFDGGTTWVSANIATISYAPFVATFVTNPANTNYQIIPLPGATHARVNVSAYTSGTVSAQLRATNRIETWPLRGIWSILGDASGVAKTATFNGATQINPGFNSAVITVTLGVVTGTTPTLNMQMQYSYNGGANWLNFAAASGNLTATSQTFILVLNGSGVGGATTGGTVNQLVQNKVPLYWRLVYTIGGTTPSFTIFNTHVTYQD